MSLIKNQYFSFAQSSLPWKLLDRVMGLDRNQFAESCNFTNKNTDIRMIKGLVKIMQSYRSDPGIPICRSSTPEWCHLRAVFHLVGYLLSDEKDLLRDQIFPLGYNRKNRKSCAFYFLMTLQPWIYILVSCIGCLSMLNLEWVMIKWKLTTQGPGKHLLHPKSFENSQERRDKGFRKVAHLPPKKTSRWITKPLWSVTPEAVDGHEPSLGKENGTSQASYIAILFLGLGVNCKLDFISDNVVLMYR